MHTHAHIRSHAQNTHLWELLRQLLRGASDVSRCDHELRDGRHHLDVEGWVLLLLRSAGICKGVTCDCAVMNSEAGLKVGNHACLCANQRAHKG